MFLINSSGNYKPNSSKMVMWPSVNFFTIFGTLWEFLGASIQKPFRRLTDTQTRTERATGCINRGSERADGHIQSVEKSRRAHIRRGKGSQGAYKAPKRAVGCCALPNKPRVSTTFKFFRHELCTKLILMKHINQHCKSFFSQKKKINFRAKLTFSNLLLTLHFY